MPAPPVLGLPQPDPQLPAASAQRWSEPPETTGPCSYLVKYSLPVFSLTLLIAIFYCDKIDITQFTILAIFKCTIQWP